MSKLEMALLGQPQFKLNGRSITHELPNKSQALLAYLAVTRQAHSREALVGLLWGEMSEENARRNLRVALTRLRDRFGDYLVIQRRTLAFNLESAYQLDVDLFEAGLRQTEPTAEQLQTAVSLYHGPFLADLALRDTPAFEEWVRPYQERLRQLAMDALYRLAVHCTQQKQYTKGIDHLSRLLILEPWLEEAHRQLMRLLVLSGQRSAALAQYDLCCNVLAEELGVSPAEATTALFQQILREEIGEDLAATAVLPTIESAARWSPPFQAPAPVRHFVGRGALQAQIIAQLKAAGAPAIHALVGMGGIGKTALAAQIAHIAQAQFADGVLWANAATSEPMAILESWAQLYGYDFSQVADLETLAAAFRGILTNKRILIVLDDVSSVSRIRPLLPGSETAAVLLTTRDQDLAHALNAQLWPLQPLLPENGRLLLTQILGQARIEAEPEAAAEICALLHNLPLAVEIMAQRLKSRPRRRLADIATRLRDETRRLSELAISDREVRASFALSYASLDADLRRTFALMGLFGGRPFTAAALAAVAEQDRYTVEDRIFALAALSLAQEEEDARYSQHPLLADFAREALGEGVAENGRLAAYYLNFAHQHRRDYSVLRPEWGSIMAAMHTVHRQQQWPLVIDFAGVLSDAWFTRGRYSEARQGYALAVEAAAQIAAGDRQAYFLHQWGRACAEQKSYQSAEEKLRQSHQCYQEMADVRGLAGTETSLARLAFEQGDLDRARQYLATSRRRYESLDDTPGLAEVGHMEARAHFFQGNYVESAGLGQQTLALWEAIDEPYGSMRTLNLLAAAAIEQNSLDEAEIFGQRSLALSETLQAKGEQAMALDVLAHIYRLRKEYGAAQTAVEKSLALLETIGDLGSQASALYQLSRIHLENGQYERAVQLGEQSLALCRTLRYRLLEIYSLTYLGDAHHCLDQVAEARHKWEEALAIARALNHPKAVRDTERRLAKN